MKILGIGTPLGHDPSFAILDAGVPVLHVEKERHTRIKMDKGYSAALALEHSVDTEGVEYLARTACVSEQRDYANEPAIQELKTKIGNCHSVWHHTSHAANAFYSSNYDTALIFTVDGGGGQRVLDDDLSTLEETDTHSRLASFAVWLGEGKRLYPVRFYAQNELDIGGLWANVTSKLFGLSIAEPCGNQSGTVMAMAALGTPGNYRFEQGMSNSALRFDESLLDASKEEKFDIAASLQKFTEELLYSTVQYNLKKYPSENICFAGGVALNSVAMGKMLNWFPANNFYVCPVPYDGGLSIGSAQYVYHHVLGQPRVAWGGNCTPYLGYTYSREAVEECLKALS